MEGIIDLTKRNPSEAKQKPITFDGLTTIYAGNTSFSDTAVESESFPQVSDTGVYRIAPQTQKTNLSNSLTAGWLVNKPFPDLVEQFEFECRVSIPDFNSNSVYGQLLGYAGITASKRFGSPVLQIFQNQIITNASADGTTWAAGDTNSVSWNVGDIVHFIYSLEKISNTTMTKRLQISINGADFVDIVNKNYEFNHIATPNLLALFFSEKDGQHNVFAGDIFMRKTKLTINNEVFIDCEN